MGVDVPSSVGKSVRNRLAKGFLRHHFDGLTSRSFNLFIRAMVSPHLHRLFVLAKNRNAFYRSAVFDDVYGLSEFDHIDAVDNLMCNGK